MPLELRQNKERVVVGLDNVVCLLEAGIECLDIAARRVEPADPLALWRLVVDGHGSVLVCPAEEGVRLALIHILLHVKYDNIVIRLHLERDAARVVLARATENELDLYVVSGPARVGVHRLGVAQVCRANEMPPLVCRIDAENAHEYVDRRERVG